MRILHWRRQHGGLVVQHRPPHPQEGVLLRPPHVVEGLHHELRLRAVHQHTRVLLQVGPVSLGGLEHLLDVSGVGGTETEGGQLGDGGLVVEELAPDGHETRLDAGGHVGPLVDVHVGPTSLGLDLAGSPVLRVQLDGRPRVLHHGLRPPPEGGPDRRGKHRSTILDFDLAQPRDVGILEDEGLPASLLLLL